MLTSLNRYNSLTRRKNTQYTSSKANKLLKKLNEEYTLLIVKENDLKTFRAAVGENVESVRPKYDYLSYKKQLETIEKQIINVKHAINIFNTTHIVKDFNMTIDELLVYIPQLTDKKKRLQEMRLKMPKKRVDNSFGRGSNIIDYEYINYDLEQIEKDYNKISDELSKAQLALDGINNKEMIEIDI